MSLNAKGDSGGPLSLTSASGQHVLIGITSCGHGLDPQTQEVTQAVSII